MLLLDVSPAVGDCGRNPRQPQDEPRLPPELVLPIMEFLLSREWRASLLQLSLGSKEYYAMGMSVLLRELEVGPPRFDASRLGNFLKDGIGFGKFALVKRLEVSMPRDPWLETSLLRLTCTWIRELKLCVGTAAHAELLFGGTEWAALKHLELRFPKLPEWRWRSGYALPSGVERIEVPVTIDGSEFEESLVSAMDKAKGLTEVRMTRSWSGRSIAAYPSFAGKIRGMKMDAGMLGKLEGSGIVRLDEIEVSGVTSDRALWSKMVSRVCPKRVVLLRCSTLCLLHGLPEGLDELELASPTFSLTEGHFAVVEGMLSSVRVTVRPDKQGGGLPGHDAEKTFWRGLANVNWVE